MSVELVAERVVGMFAKPVVPGDVKTRLTPPLTPERAARLYGAFLGDLAAMLDAGKDSFDWMVFTPAPQALRNTWPEDTPAPSVIERQTGADLGARMDHALTTLLAPPGRKAAVIIGSDAPTVDRHQIDLAFAKLEHHDLVFGPAWDGGYYLVGASAPHGEVFGDIVWSSPDVLSETLKRVRAHDLRAGFLPPWYDVDEAQDLAFLRVHLQAMLVEHGSAAPCPRTRTAMGLDPNA
jgi:hypothetical protein